ncbi:delta-class carbonic anhydrase [Microbulbifer sp. DLAB2-AF]|uniref:delta-class carbonic anhydrase n=1 Tax=Microbulbifer sp. DLAB2-AF TaxID=3243395 RepID=UPI00403A3BA9
MKIKSLFVLAATTTVAFNTNALDSGGAVSDEAIANQRANLEKNTTGRSFGPQSPRDIESTSGNHTIFFAAAPAHTVMNLCNIHFHKNAEHKGGEFTQYAGNGDGRGFLSGYKYSSTLTAAELAPLNQEVCPSDHGSLYPGDTIEVHYVHSSAKIKPGPTLGSCFNEEIKNPQLRVETQVYVLVNDSTALDFVKLTAHDEKSGFQQALGIPSNTGKPIQYSGSTTGPDYNEQGSPYQVTWSVRPNVAKVNITSVGNWCKDNIFNEDHAHGVRNLIQNPKLLSEIKH